VREGTCAVNTASRVHRTRTQHRRTRGTHQGCTPLPAGLIPHDVRPCGVCTTEGERVGVRVRGSGARRVQVWSHAAGHHWQANKLLSPDSRVSLEGRMLVTWVMVVDVNSWWEYKERRGAGGGVGRGTSRQRARERGSHAAVPAHAIRTNKKSQQPWQSPEATPAPSPTSRKQRQCKGTTECVRGRRWETAAAAVGWMRG
jgi:hypothetical protein